MYQHPIIHHFRRPGLVILSSFKLMVRKGTGQELLNSPSVSRLYKECQLATVYTLGH